jgi:hypothetical protein
MSGGHDGGGKGGGRIPPRVLGFLEDPSSSSSDSNGDTDDFACPHSRKSPKVKRPKERSSSGFPLEQHLFVTNAPIVKMKEPERYDGKD